MVSKRYNIFLDLDSTCIYSLEVDDTDEKHIKALRDAGMVVKKMNNSYWVVQRPGLQKFLDFLFENFNVSVWTAATKSYALWIINKYLTPPGSNRQLQYILWNEHCDMCENKYKADVCKDLSIFWRVYGISGFDETNTIIIDDNHMKVWNSQECNCLLIRPFEAYDLACKDDDDLERVEDHLKKLLRGELDDKCIVDGGMYDEDELDEILNTVYDDDDTTVVSSILGDDDNTEIDEFLEEIETQN